ILWGNRRQRHSVNAHLLYDAGIRHLRLEEQLRKLRDPLRDMPVQDLASVDHAEKGRHLRSLSAMTDVLDKPRQCPKRQHRWNNRNQDQIGGNKDILTQYREARRTIQQHVRIPAPKLLEHFGKVAVGPAQPLEEAIELTIREVRRQEVEVLV